ncbi:hypothetical protein D3C72_1489150 [compost metagenome]
MVICCGARVGQGDGSAIGDTAVNIKRTLCITGAQSGSAINVDLRCCTVLKQITRELQCRRVGEMNGFPKREIAPIGKIVAAASKTPHCQSIQSQGVSACAAIELRCLRYIHACGKRERIIAFVHGGDSYERAAAGLHGVVAVAQIDIAGDGATGMNKLIGSSPH